MTFDRADQRLAPWGVAGLYALAGLTGLGVGLYDRLRFWDNAASNLGEVAFGVAMLAAAVVTVRRREGFLGDGLPAVIALAGAVALFVGVQIDSTAQGHPLLERQTIVLLVVAFLVRFAVPPLARWRARRSVR